MRLFENVYSCRKCESSPQASMFNRSGGPGRSNVQLGSIADDKSYTNLSSTKQARVLYDYDASDTTELSLLADEVGLIEQVT